MDVKEKTLIQLVWHTGADANLKKETFFYHILQARSGQAACIHTYNHIIILNLRWEVV